MAFSASEHMMKLKGKDYLQVAWRLVWFREEHPDWGISTEIINYDPAAKHCICRAVICDADGAQKSSGTGSESAKDFGDFIEKAETKAVGRALAMLGYGTQFCADELDEGERIVDSPIDRKPNAGGRAAGKEAPTSTGTPLPPADRTGLITQEQVRQILSLLPDRQRQRNMLEAYNLRSLSDMDGELAAKVIRKLERERDEMQGQTA